MLCVHHISINTLISRGHKPSPTVTPGLVHPTLVRLANPFAGFIRAKNPTIARFPTFGTARARRSPQSERLVATVAQLR